MLGLTVAIPFIGALILMPLNDKSVSQQNNVKTISLIISIIGFIVSLFVWISFDIGQTGYQMVEYANIGFANIHIGIDGLSLFYVILTTFLTPICLLASWSNTSHNVKMFNVLQQLTCGILLAVFVQLDLLLFYVSFEAVLVPLFFLVGMWGGSPTRVRSALLLFLYTLAGSLFMLLSIVALYGHIGTLDMTILPYINLDSNVQYVLWCGFAIAIAVKTPLVPFHIWLPRAHADAPLAGSMVLAGTVLKLATYGILRVMLPVLPDACSYFNPIVQTVAIISLIYSSLATIRQVDFKAMVAYSSVSHMAVVVLGLFSNTFIGISGAILLSLAHGLVSPALFMLVGGVLYDRFHTRSIRYYRGLASMMPVFSAIFFLFICANMGVPLSVNWVGEFLSLCGTFIQSPIAGVLGSTGIVFSACYSIWLWGRLIAGSYSQHLSYTIDLIRREYAVLLPLLVMTIYFGVCPNIILDTIGPCVTALLYQSLVL
jgi:NADH-ubiquinone oxidoreductase chain 4